MDLWVSIGEDGNPCVVFGQTLDIATPFGQNRRHADFGRAQLGRLTSQGAAEPDTLIWQRTDAIQKSLDQIIIKKVR